MFSGKRCVRGWVQVARLIGRMRLSRLRACTEYIGLTLRWLELPRSASGAGRLRKSAGRMSGRVLESRLLRELAACDGSGWCRLLW